MAIGDKLSALEQKYINWNYLGIAAGVLVILVNLYNIRTYLQKVRKS